MSHRVKIDGKETVLTFDCYSGSRGYQYLTTGNTSSHAFSQRLKAGQYIITNGHTYEVLS